MRIQLTMTLFPQRHSVQSTRHGNIKSLLCIAGVTSRRDSEDVVGARKEERVRSTEDDEDSRVQVDTALQFSSQSFTEQMQDWKIDDNKTLRSEAPTEERGPIPKNFRTKGVIYRDKVELTLLEDDVSHTRPMTNQIKSFNPTRTSSGDSPYIPPSIEVSSQITEKNDEEGMPPLYEVDEDDLSTAESFDPSLQESLRLRSLLERSFSQTFEKTRSFSNERSLRFSTIALQKRRPVSCPRLPKDADRGAYHGSELLCQPPSPSMVDNFSSMETLAMGLAAKTLGTTTTSSSVQLKNSPSEASSVDGISEVSHLRHNQLKNQRSDTTFTDAVSEASFSRYGSVATGRTSSTQSWDRQDEEDEMSHSSEHIGDYFLDRLQSYWERNHLIGSDHDLVEGVTGAYLEKMEGFWDQVSGYEMRQEMYARTRSFVK